MRLRLGFIALTLFSLSGLSCTQFAATASPESGNTKPKEYIVVIDLSASRTPDMLEESRNFLNRLIQNLHFDDQIVLLEMQQAGLTDHPRRWHGNMPSAKDPSFPTYRDKAQLDGAKKSVAFNASTFFKDQGKAKVMHTDILTTLHLAGEFARDSGERPAEIVILSDMLQSVQGFEMQGLARMPKAGWVESQARKGLMPQLSRACVLVVGADATTEAGVKVRQFWQSYFASAGATLSLANYRATPPNSIADDCK